MFKAEEAERMQGLRVIHYLTNRNVEMCQRKATELDAILKSVLGLRDKFGVAPE